KVNLSLFGLYPREHCPTIPPELILLPGRVLHQMSSWTRAIAVSLALVQSAKPIRPVPDGFDLRELFLPGVSPAFRRDRRWLSRRNLFLRLDQAFKLWERVAPAGLRRSAIRKCERWMLERSEDSDGLGAIYPPMMYAVMALDVLGYRPDHPARREALAHFENLMVDDGERFFLRPCFSPVWDTAIAGYALAQAGYPAAELRRSAEWLLAREVRRRGDWAVKRPGLAPSGWAFEFRNPFYPDIDDTAMVLLALARGRGAKAQEPTLKRGITWLVGMQSRDGGWAAFDADNSWEFLSDVPFADHNAMLDPACPDITGRVLEALAAHGLGRDHPAVRRGVDYLVRTQEADGSWYGRWGVAYIYGTCFALRGLAAAGESDREAHMLRAAEWLRSIQNAGGGWGESCASYESGGYAPAESTPSQTAWALLGLFAAGDTRSRSVEQGIEYLLDTQQAEGGWEEELSTGTGFPKVFYLKYDLYRLYFPLLALAEYRRARA
ncbi:MAG: squalene--hopene cyclase, partial [Acidobacteria bacterium]|nr:squalene--hopene cyclase [Acidobacteriota bacterium]